MPSELEPARRLLQAVCYPGHGVLVRGGRLAVSSGDAEIVAALVALAPTQPGARAFTVMLDEKLQVCAERDGTQTLLVAVPREIDAVSVHEKMSRAMQLYAAPRAMPWMPGGGSGGGSSGAPAEVFVRNVRPRPS